jgi:hypothetical protein
MLLYAEIDSFSRYGECFASNDHFAKYLKVSKDRISKLLTNLRRKGYINIELIYKKGTKEIEKRIIRPTSLRDLKYGRNDQDPIGDMDIPSRTNDQDPLGEVAIDPIGENAYDNNTSITKQIKITNNNKNTKKNLSSSELEREFERLWKLYPRKMGKANAQKSFIKARKTGKIPYEIIENGIYRYIDYLEAQGTEEQYIMHGSTWFGQMKWQDEYTTTGLNRKPKNATEYLQAKYGGNPHGSYGNRKIIDYDTEIISEPF